MIFKTNIQPGGSARLTVQHDAYTNGKPWIKNVTKVNGETVPMYKYKEGLNPENTPRPYQEDVELITDYSSFKAGGKAPYVIGIKDATWGGSKDDIVTKGINDGTSWTIEFARKLDTGYPDDIEFDVKSPSDYAFVVIVRDGGKGYAIGSPVFLKFGK